MSEIRKKLVRSFRRLFTFPLAEELLYRLVKNKSSKSIYRKLIPTEFLYPKPTIRKAIRNEINFELDISNLNDHWVYFGYQERNLNAFFKILKPDFVVIDVGANIGYTTLMIAKNCPQGNVIAYEPDTDNFNRLNRNCSLNNFSNVQIIKSGLGSAEGWQTLYKVDSHNSGMNRIAGNNDLNKDEEQIQITTLDQEASRLKLPKIDLIKIDVEGYEQFVLQGAINSLRQFKPILFIEVIDVNLKPHNTSGNNIVQFLSHLGYNLIDAKTKDRIVPGVNRKFETDILAFPN